MNEIKEESLLAESAQAKQFSPKLYLGIGGVMVVGALIFGLSSGGEPVVESEILEAKAVKDDIVLAISTTGSVISLTDVDLFFPSQGILKDIQVSEGQAVKAGAILAKQDTRDAGLDIAQAELTLKTAQANIAANNGEAGFLTTDVAKADLERAKSDLDILYADQPADAEDIFKQSLIKVSQAEDVFNNALHAVDVTFIIDTRTVAYSKGEMGERLDTMDNYETAIEAYDVFIDSLEVQKRSIDQTQFKLLVTEAENLVKSVNRALQAGINSLQNSEPLQDFTQSIIDSSLANLQSHQSKVKDQALVLTQLSEALNSIDSDQAQDVKDQLAFIRSLELKVSGADQGIVSSEAQVSQARISLSSAQLKYENLILRAPISGTVGPIEFRVGEYVGVDKDTPVLSIVGGEGVSIEAYVEESDVAKVEVDQTTLVSFDAFDSRPFEGLVTFISSSPSVDSNGIVTYRMVVSVDTEDERIRDGMTTYVDVVTSGVLDVLVIPVASVRPHDGVPSVQKEDGEWVPVTTGFTDGNNVEVISGLKTGDVIIYGE